MVCSVGLSCDLSLFSFVYIFYSFLLQELDEDCLPNLLQVLVVQELQPNGHFQLDHSMDKQIHFLNKI